MVGMVVLIGLGALAYVGMGSFVGHTVRDLCEKNSIDDPEFCGLMAGAFWPLTATVFLIVVLAWGPFLLGKHLAGMTKVAS